MIDLVQYLPGKRKQTGSGWVSFNAPCCVYNGESADRRKRGGIKSTNEGWSYHCFNCQFTASFILGRNLTFKARKLLTWLNVPQEEIERLNLESLRHRSIEGMIDSRKTFDTLADIQFEDVELPPGELLDNTMLEWQYVRDRCVPSNYPVLRFGYGDADRAGAVIPFTYNNHIVGSTVRFLDDRTPRYINDFPPGYVFGTDLQHDNWQHVIVVEGVFDALSISGLAVMHNTVNDMQARLIRSLGREITVVPDQDLAGMKLVDRAIELGWAVSMPHWEDCKDVNDAVIKHGQLTTLIAIMQAKETSRIKIEMRKKQLIKKLNHA